MSQEVWQDGVLRKWWNDGNRTYKEFGVNGVETFSRPYSLSENTDADRSVATSTELSNQMTVVANLESDLAAMQAIIDDTNSNINSNPAARIKDIARAIRRLTRVAISDYGGSA